jgi:hypothetical protein
LQPLIETRSQNMPYATDILQYSNVSQNKFNIGRLQDNFEMPLATFTLPAKQLDPTLECEKRGMRLAAEMHCADEAPGGVFHPPGY